jgi:Family of unknown function (DUF5320)
MPGLDGTGPNGMGPMTGRGMGYCIIPISTCDEELIYLKKRVEVLSRQLKQSEELISEILRAQEAL